MSEPGRDMFHSLTGAHGAKFELICTNLYEPSLEDPWASPEECIRNTLKQLKQFNLNTR